jgi:DNA-binding LacI/PurR family transcriptional regulator
MTDGVADGAPAVSGRAAPGMKDVARLAGVSHQTVSRVLNESPNVRPHTRTRVLAAMETLGYRPNRAARALVTGRSQVIGVATLSGGLYGPASALYGVESAAAQVGYAVSVVGIREVSAAELRQAVTQLMRQGVDGVIVITPLRVAQEELDLLAGEVPLVSLEGAAGGVPSVVGVDQVAGARLAVGHLIELGHRTVWHVAGPRDWFESEGRVDGWRSVLTEADREIPPVLTGDWSPKAGYDAGLLLARLPEVTAVFSANDQMALGILRALTEHGRRVPDEISVVGFDDLPEAEYFLPPLTTVRQDFTEVGRQGVARLLDLIGVSGPAGSTRSAVPPASQASTDHAGGVVEAVPPPGSHLIEPTLVVRRSTAPLAVA